MALLCTRDAGLLLSVIVIYSTSGLRVELDIICGRMISYDPSVAEAADGIGR